MLGTPSIRCNMFVGRIHYLEEEEHRYGLTYGFRPEESEGMFQRVEELLGMGENKNTQNPACADINKENKLTKKEESTVADSNSQDLASQSASEISVLPHEVQTIISRQLDNQVPATDNDAHHLLDSSEKNESLHDSEKNPKNGCAVNALKAEWGKRREVLLKEKIDYTGFQVWFVENWPKSVEMVRKADGEFWKRFM